MNSTSDTANENFITDHGSIRLTIRRARRGPRGVVAVVREVRMASPTRAAPTAVPVLIGRMVTFSVGRPGPPSAGPATSGAGAGASSRVAEARPVTRGGAETGPVAPITGSEPLTTPRRARNEGTPRI